MRAALLLGLAACAEPHTLLQGPTAATTPAERVAMFHAFERAGQNTLSISRNHGPYELAGAELVLANGTHIELPEDLQPVVPPESDTARAAVASAAAGHRANTWMYIGIGAVVASAITVIAADTGSINLGISDDYLWPGVALVSAIPFFAAKQARNEELQLRMQAFSTYTRDLGLRLDVCAHGLEVVPCETAQPLAPPGLAPAGGSAPPFVEPQQTVPLPAGGQ